MAGIVSGTDGLEVGIAHPAPAFDHVQRLIERGSSTVIAASSVLPSLCPHCTKGLLAQTISQTGRCGKQGRGTVCHKSDRAEILADIHLFETRMCPHWLIDRITPRRGMPMSEAMLLLERRAATRNRSYKGGKLVFKDNQAVLDCTVRNLSATGALLEIQAVATVPEEFDLHADGWVRGCKVLWRRHNRIGVKFK